MEILNTIKKFCECKQDVNLKNLCSIHIGGVAKYVCYPNSYNSLKKLISFFHKNNIRYYIIGNGTNIVFKDGEFSAVLISLTKLNSFKITNNSVTAYAGIPLIKLCNELKKNELSGLEWAYGIPGTVGGAVVMNAGAFGFDMSSVIEYVWVLEGGKLKKLSASELEFNYRYSIIQKNKNIVVKAKFKLKKGNFCKIEKKQNDYLTKRKLSQPYGTFNCGSVFKKTNGESAGKVIDKLGLKGAKIGDIQISTKHANFFINLGNASWNDFYDMVCLAKKKAFENYGIDLQEEVIFVDDKKD